LKAAHRRALVEHIWSKHAQGMDACQREIIGFS
jgi:hypothetical protein